MVEEAFKPSYPGPFSQSILPTSCCYPLLELRKGSIQVPVVKIAVSVGKYADHGMDMEKD